jgi:hypothetical protein
MLRRLMRFGMHDIGDLAVTDTIKKMKPLRAVYGNIDDDKVRILNNRFCVKELMFGLLILGLSR